MVEPGSFQVSGNVDGNVAWGDNNIINSYKLSIHDIHGAFIVQQALPPVIKIPLVSPPPKKVPGFVNRTAELAKLESWIAGNRSVLLHGPDGMGKSSLLRQAANSATAKTMSDGVLWLKGVDVERLALGPDDLVQSLFDLLFQSNPHLKVNMITARTYLSSTRPLVVMDEVALSPALQEALPDLFPKGAILLSASAPFGAEFERLRVGALPRAEALTLLATRAELSLNDANRPALEQICALLGDISLGLVVTGNVLRETNTSPSAASQAIEAVSAPERDPALAALHRAFGFAFSLLTLEERQVLSAAALTPGASMSPEWLSAALGVASIDTLLERLKAFGLLFTNSPRLRLPLGFATPARSAAALLPHTSTLNVLDENIFMPSLVKFLLTPLQNNPHDWEYIHDELGNFFGALTWAVRVGRLDMVIRLGRALDPYLTLHGLWDAWGVCLGHILNAARQSGQKAVEAWALHQSGTREFGVGTRREALHLLRQALELRRTLGDTVGMAYTQHNIDLLMGPPPPPDKPQTPKPPKPASKGPNWFGLIIGMVEIIGFITLTGLGILWLVIGNLFPQTHPINSQSTPLPIAKETNVAVFTPLPGPTYTPYPTYTDYPTLTPISTPTMLPILTILIKDAQTLDAPILYQGNNVQDDQDEYFEVPVTISIDNPNNVNLEQASLSISNDGADVEFRRYGESSYQKTTSVGGSSSFDLNLKIPSKNDRSQSLKITAKLDICTQNIQCQPHPIKIKLPQVVYDFIGRYQNVQWAGHDPATRKYYSGHPYDPNMGGIVYIQLLDQQLADGARPFVLHTHPDWAENESPGVIGNYENGQLPTFKPGDRLMTSVMFFKVNGAIDGVTFNIGYSGDGGPSNIFHLNDNRADGKMKGETDDLPINVIDGKFSYLYLQALPGKTTDSGATLAASGDPTTDWAAWICAYIARW